MVIFEKGTKNKFLNALGLKYGFLYIEENPSPAIIELESAHKILATLMQEKLCEEKEAWALLLEMEDYGILKTLPDVFYEVRRNIVPLDFSPTLNFELCNCQEPSPVIHGHVMVRKTDYRVSGQITALSMGFRHCNYMVHNHRVSLLNAVVVLKEMLASNLPLLDEKNSDNLPEKMAN